MNNKTNWKSRKFWISVAAFLASIGAGITGLVIKEYDLTTVGVLCSVFAAGIYAACNAYQTGQIAKANKKPDIINNCDCVETEKDDEEPLG